MVSIEALAPDITKTLGDADSNVRRSAVAALSQLRSAGKKMKHNSGCLLIPPLKTSGSRPLWVQSRSMAIY
jgi:hypothetical protein